VARRARKKSRKLKAEKRATGCSSVASMKTGRASVLASPRIRILPGRSREKGEKWAREDARPPIREFSRPVENEVHEILGKALLQKCKPAGRFVRGFSGTAWRSAGFQTCCIADFQIGESCDVMRRTGLEAGDAPDSETPRSKLCDRRLDDP
jgi:hypothetical protein